MTSGQAIERLVARTFNVHMHAGRYGDAIERAQFRRAMLLAGLAFYGSTGVPSFLNPRAQA